MPMEQKPPNPPVNRNRGPGPAAVMLPTTVGFKDHDPTKTRAPNYTMRPKPPLVDRRVRPPPNQYTIEKYYTRFGKDGTPQYTARWPLDPLSMPKSPGPMAYRVEDVPVLKTNRAPEYSLNDRHRQRSVTQPPAPNAYKLPEVIGENVIYKPNAPSYTLRLQRQRSKDMSADVTKPDQSTSQL